MKLKSFTFLLLATILVGFTKDDFKKEQLKYPTVRTAYNEKWAGIKTKLSKEGVDTLHFEIYIRVFKHEAKLEVWAKSKKPHSI